MDISLKDIRGKGRRRFRLASSQNWLCHWCHRRMRMTGRRLLVTRDHLRPSKVIVAACFTCNKKRAALGDPLDFEPSYR